MPPHERVLRALHWQAELRAAEQDAQFAQAAAHRRAAGVALREGAARRLALHDELRRQQSQDCVNPALVMSLHRIFREATERERSAHAAHEAAVSAEARRAEERALSRRRADRIEQAADETARARARARSAHEERTLDDLWLSRMTRTGA